MESRSSDRTLKPLPPDPVRHQDSAIARARISNRDDLMKIRRTIRTEIEACIRDVGGTCEIFSGCNCQLRINGEIDVTVIVGRAPRASVARRQNEWKFEYRSRRKPDILIVARVENGSSVIRDYYVLPYLFLPAGTALTISGRNYQRLEGFHSASLARFYRLCARQSVSVSAHE